MVRKFLTINGQRCFVDFEFPVRKDFTYWALPVGNLSFPDDLSPEDFRVYKVEGHELGAMIQRSPTDWVILDLAHNETRRLEAIMKLALPMADQHERIGDLIEKYAENIRGLHGPVYARLWLWRHGVSIMVRGLGWRGWAAMAVALWQLWRKAGG